MATTKRATALDVVRALDRWAAAGRGRSWETGKRNDSNTWHATAWDNGKEVEVLIAGSPDEARNDLVWTLYPKENPYT